MRATALPESVLRLTRGAAHQSLPRAEVDALVARAQAGDRRARERLIATNTRWVAARVRRLRLKAPGAEEDLFSWGLLGLNKAIDKFELGRGMKLLTYATWWIDAEIRRGAMGEDFIHVPAFLHEGRGSERARGLARDAARRPTSLQVRVGEDGETELGDLLAASGPGPEDLVADAEARAEACAQLEALLPGLKPKEQQVMRLRLAEGMPNLYQAGDALDLTRERIRQLEKAAIGRLAKKLGSDRPVSEIYRDYLDARRTERVLEGDIDRREVFQEAKARAAGASVRGSTPPHLHRERL